MKSGVVVLALIALMVSSIESSGNDAILCNMTEDGLNACKPSVTQPSPVVPPSPDCCKALSGANLSCLCSYKHSLVLPALGIDPDLAMALPAQCNLTNPANC